MYIQQTKNNFYLIFIDSNYIKSRSTAQESNTKDIIQDDDNINTNPKKIVLDLCCCPGMKYNSIMDKLRPSDILIGVDVNQTRYYHSMEFIF